MDLEQLDFVVAINWAFVLVRAHLSFFLSLSFSSSMSSSSFGFFDVLGVVSLFPYFLGLLPSTPSISLIMLFSCGIFLERYLDPMREIGRVEDAIQGMVVEIYCIFEGMF
jgi:hypothetical protein